MLIYNPCLSGYLFPSRPFLTVISSMFFYPSRDIGKEQRPIKSDAKENMMSLGEQHLFFRHQRDPIGFPRKTEFYPLQCSTCEWFFPVQRILDSHVQNCDGAEGRKQAAKNGGKEKNNNDGVCANKNVAVVSKAASTAARAPKAASIAKNASMAVSTVGKVSAKYF